MLRLAADENVDARVLRVLLLRPLGCATDTAAFGTLAGRVLRLSRVEKKPHPLWKQTLARLQREAVRKRVYP